MAGKRITSNKEGKEELAIYWDPGFIPCRITYYGQVIGVFNSMAELVRGKEFVFNNGEILLVRFNREMAGFEFKRNGKYLSVSGVNPLDFLTFPFFALVIYSSIMLIISSMIVLTWEYDTSLLWFVYNKYLAGYSFSLVVMSFFFRKGFDFAFWLASSLLGGSTAIQVYLFFVEYNDFNVFHVFMALLLLIKLLLLRSIIQGWNKYSAWNKKEEDQEILV
ncbi:MAG: hypothetical protein K1X56_03825 [Flavobacteriales bacterium]|nr:hypothetical protein [Flavobacteriales bacterium]